MTKTFNLHFGIKGKPLESQTMEFKDESEALNRAEELAHEVYYLNPIYDVLEIMEIEYCDEDMAREIFNHQMAMFTEFHVIDVTPMEI